MKITIAGAGYVGLVTGVCLADAGHQVTCMDVDTEKISGLSQGIPPIYEPGLEKLLQKNLQQKSIRFTTNPAEAYSRADSIMIAVATPENEDGSACLDYIEQVALSIAAHLKQDAIVAVKSTVPVGTNEWAARLIRENADPSIEVQVVSNPEFLREGSAIYDTLHADRIIIGSGDDEAGKKAAKMYASFSAPIIHTDIRSAELVKYAANSFLATKISFMNEIANLCELTGADVEDVALGMGLDQRIGTQYLKAGIGYGGSCFPKDMKALEKLTEYYQYDFKILRSVVEVNSRQRLQLIRKAKELFGSLFNKKTAVLGLSFKPGTDDIRDAPALEIIETLLAEGCEVTVYDPAVRGKVKDIFGASIASAETIEEAIGGADVAFIITEWPEISEFPLHLYKLYMNQPVIFDGRNCYSLEETEKHGLQYFSIGRKAIKPQNTAKLIK